MLKAVRSRRASIDGSGRIIAIQRAINESVTDDDEVRYTLDLVTADRFRADLLSLGLVR